MSAYPLGRETADDAMSGAQPGLEECVDRFRETATRQWGSLRRTDILGMKTPADRIKATADTCRLGPG